ncbi:MAG: hypothetical protein DRP42_05710 [Tenericutes bacterium]|nr:MAG: hypothetical protein DRP42_05710 [Mycoplasmatota bacterium]
MNTQDQIAKLLKEILSKRAQLSEDIRNLSAMESVLRDPRSHGTVLLEDPDFTNLVVKVQSREEKETLKNFLQTRKELQTIELETIDSKLFRVGELMGINDNDNSTTSKS